MPKLRQDKCGIKEKARQGAFIPRKDINKGYRDILSRFGETPQFCNRPTDWRVRNRIKKNDGKDNNTD